MGLEVPDADLQTLILGVQPGEPLLERHLAGGWDYRSEIRGQRQQARIHAAGIRGRGPGGKPDAATPQGEPGCLQVINHNGEEVPKGYEV